MFRVLFVCTGNICRSPIAHGLLADRVKRLGAGVIEIGSAGTWGRGGSPATSEAVSAAARLGVDIEAHRASRFTAELAGRADLVITMTTGQAAEVLEQEPEARPKTFTLKELVSVLSSLPQPPAPSPTREALLERVRQADHARSGDFRPPADLDVADPLGLSETVYRAVADELERLIDQLMRGLVGSASAPMSAAAE